MIHWFVIQLTTYEGPNEYDGICKAFQCSMKKPNSPTPFILIKGQEGGRDQWPGDGSMAEYRPFGGSSKEYL